MCCLAAYGGRPANVSRSDPLDTAEHGCFPSSSDASNELVAQRSRDERCHDVGRCPDVRDCPLRFDTAYTLDQFRFYLSRVFSECVGPMCISSPSHADALNALLTGT